MSQEICIKNFSRSLCQPEQTAMEMMAWYVLTRNVYILFFECKKFKLVYCLFLYSRSSRRDGVGRDSLRAQSETTYLLQDSTFHCIPSHPSSTTFRSNALSTLFGRAGKKSILVSASILSTVTTNDVFIHRVRIIIMSISLPINRIFLVPYLTTCFTFLTACSTPFSTGLTAE
jgi:hypothetical protein